MVSDVTESMGTELLRMEGVHKRFGATKALSGVDLHVRAGEVLALVGENGAGKSTLMKVLAGAHQADEGHMYLAGQPYQPRNPLDSRRAGVCMIYQELALAPHLTVMENILLGMEPVKGPVIRWAEMRKTAAAAMEQLGRSDIRPETVVQRLSIAEQQLVEIARAIAVGCRVLVLDEPTSSLTHSDIVHLFDLVRRLRKQGLGIIYISHFLEEVRELSDRVTVLRDGRSVGGGPIAVTSNKEIIAMMVGRSVEDLYPRSKRVQGEPVLEIKHLSGRSRPVDVSLTLHRGEVLGISGIVGAGRTELFRAIFGLDRIYKGEIRLGTHVGPAAPVTQWARGMGMVSEDRKTEGLALQLSIADNTTLSSLGAIVRPAQQEASTQRWIERLSIRCRSPRQAVGSLSGGNQQKVAIARLLEHEAEVLLLDEPTRGIDVGAKAQIYQLIDELACQGKAILMISSYLPELLGICDRIAVMCKGRLGFARPVGELNEHQIMMEATGAKESAGEFV
jgi:ribose transport system ATP-binding protein